MTAAAPIALLVGAFLSVISVFLSSKYGIIFYNINRYQAWYSAVSN